ncbi:fatty acid desaturase [uncultured Pelagimonas sp.]|uniref:fatty acid desaturase n=1 Tax=uncultured Pelagimonas sp. TaxID=1618102 RepID=UPI00345A315A
MVDSDWRMIKTYLERFSIWMSQPSIRHKVEWPTIALLLICYFVWGVSTTWVAEIWLPLGMVLACVSAALHSSLTHEALHGHPTKSAFWNAVLVFPALSVVVPYLRFKDLHLAHHRESILTDPYDDPESNYLDPIVWADLPNWRKRFYRINNTLAGRLIFGPVMGTWAFAASDWKAIKAGDRRVLLGWVLHVPAMTTVILWFSLVGNMPVWAWLVSVYGALSILKIRTFLEHRAHDHAPGRTVVVEDKGLLSLIFLNNNLHVVHHMHSMVPWYRLPNLYWRNKDRYLGRNCGYVYPSYAAIFRQYMFRSKDPVPHPFWPKP